MTEISEELYTGANTWKNLETAFNQVRSDAIQILILDWKITHVVDRLIRNNDRFPMGFRGSTYTMSYSTLTTNTVANLPHSNCTSTSSFQLKLQSRMQAQENISVPACRF